MPTYHKTIAHIAFSLLIGVMACGLAGCSHESAEDRGGDAVGYEIDGDEFLKVGNIPAAIQKYQLAVRTEPTSWQHHRALALGYEHENNYAAAVSDVSEFRVVLALNDQIVAKGKAYNPASVSVVHYWLSEALKRDGKGTEANAEASRALQIAETDKKHSKKIAAVASTLRTELGKSTPKN